MMPEQRPEFCIFYAWQSDRSGSRNRYFIQDAAAEAAALLNAEDERIFDVRIDQDTQGVPGLCDIPATILKKIDTCDAFLCDLTYVATTSPEDDGEDDFEPRHCSNPNVLFELGYAFRSLGPERVVCVMNEQYGPVAKQIFDLAHRRFPIAYRLPGGSRSKKEVRGELVKKLVKAIRELMPLGRRDDGSQDRITKIRNEFEDAVRKGQFHNLVRHGGAVAIALIPPPGLSFTHEQLQAQHIPPPGRRGWNNEIRGKSILSVGGHDEEQLSISEIRSDGVIFGADTLVLDPRNHGEMKKVVPSVGIERLIIGTTTQFCHALQALHAPLPWSVCISLLDLKDHWLYASDGQATWQKLRKQDIVLEPLSVKRLSDVADQASVAAFLRPAIDHVWQEFGFSGSSNYTQKGIYNFRF